MASEEQLVLAAILTLNTFAHTLGAAGVGAEAALLWGDAWVGVMSFVVTMLILVFSEIIPKTLGAVHSKSFAPFAVWIIQYLIILLRPVVAVCNWISFFISRHKQAVPRMSREEMRSISQMALDEGVIDQSEAGILRNLIALRNVTAEEVITPRTVTRTFRAAQTVGDVTDVEPPRFARIPVIGESLEDIKGLVYIYDLFKAHSEGRAKTTLDKLVRPIHLVPEAAKLPAVLNKFLQQREQMVLVVDEYGGTAGIITLEDVLETLFGVEIMDETDEVEDMRKLAKQLLTKRHYSKELIKPQPKTPCFF